MNTHPTLSFQGYTHPTPSFQGIGLVSTPAVEFIATRQHSLSPEQVAHRRTGRNTKTGELVLGVSVRRHHSGLIRIQADLIRLSQGLTSDAIEQLQHYWHQCTPTEMQARMKRHFGRTYVCFDTLEGQVDGWLNFLSTVLSDAGSYAVSDCDRVEKLCRRVMP